MKSCSWSTNARALTPPPRYTQHYISLMSFFLLGERWCHDCHSASHRYVRCLLCWQWGRWWHTSRSLFFAIAWTSSGANPRRLQWRASLLSSLSCSVVYFFRCIIAWTDWLTISTFCRFYLGKPLGSWKQHLMKLSWWGLCGWCYYRSVCIYTTIYWLSYSYWHRKFENFRFAGTYYWWIIKKRDACKNIMFFACYAATFSIISHLYILLNANVGQFSYLWKKDWIMN